MSSLQLIVAVTAGVVLFLFGIDHFSREVQAISGASFRKFLARSTKNPLLGFSVGALLTAIIQSSTATSVIAVGLVNAGVLSFRNTLGVLFGANVGTTVTAQLVALELTSFAPALILLGFVVGLIPFRWKIFGRSIFYFGLVFFSLNLVATAVQPMRDDPTLIAVLSSVRNPFLAVLVGAVFTMIVQSSSVTTGLAIVLLQQGVLPFETALPILLGGNVGTTITALIASVSFSTSARRTAVSHALYNVGGVVLFMPLLVPFQVLLKSFGQAPANTLALAHLIFNVVCAALFLLAIKPFAALVERLVPDSETTDPIAPPPKPSEKGVDHDLEMGRLWVAQIIDRLEPGYTAAVLGLQTRDKKIANRADRTLAIINFGLEEGRALIGRLSRQELSREQSGAVLSLVISLDHVRQMADSIEDLGGIGEGLSKRAQRFSMNALLDIQRVYPLTAKLIQTLALLFRGEARDGDVESLDLELQTTLSSCYLRFIELARTEKEGIELADFLSVHARLRGKLHVFAEHIRERAHVESSAEVPSASSNG